MAGGAGVKIIGSQRQERQSGQGAAWKETEMNHLLLYSVGGSPEPVAASIAHWKPARVIFLPSLETQSQIEQIVAGAAERGFDIPPGCYETRAVRDAEDFGACVSTFRELNHAVHEWLARGDKYGVIVDFTGGTKCMTSALALQARGWPCSFSYIGGGERTKNGVGIVVSGKERVLRTENPWNVLGYQAVEEAVTLFDRGARAEAAKLLEWTAYRISDGRVKRELTTLLMLVKAYDAWDRFDHKYALGSILNALKNGNDLLALFGGGAYRELCERLREHSAYLKYLVARRGKPDMAFATDLLANAKRRAEEGRFDDAVCRVYRAVEAIAQAVLNERGFENTKEIPIDRLPAKLQDKWSGWVNDGMVSLALQDAYELLREIGDGVSESFIALGWDNRKECPLSARNTSILAHGFEPVSESVFQQLWKGSLKLAGVTGDSLPRFPKLAANQPQSNPR